MALSPGTRLGHYEILAPLGAGGMGEVYRARDTRLAREVALKILPREVASDPIRLKRFEKEALAASALSHPNIVTVFDAGTDDSTSWIAMELIAGKTLREILLAGALPIKKALNISTQAADGLSRAHEAGIVHRDLKPENLMVTKDGLLKILDFGLAKLGPAGPGDGRGSLLPTLTETSPGTVVGTVSYMSPEQACGHPVDFRSDQFSFGAILYEMVTGKRAFQKANAPDTLSAILHEEPPPMTQTAARAPAPLGWVAERCLAKDPADRYASTRDLASDLASVRDRLSQASGSVPSIESPRRRRRFGAAAIAAALLLIGGSLWLGSRLELARASSPHFRQLTFRGAGIGTARFAPDGQSIVYSAETEGRPPELFFMRLDSLEARSLGLPPAQLLSISPMGQMAILLLKPFALSPRIGHAWEEVIDRGPLVLEATLAQAPLAGGAPRELLENVLFADWAPDGESLSVVHRAGNRSRLESPIGKVIYDSEIEVLNSPRFSPRGGSLAFKDWDQLFVTDAAGTVRHVAMAGQQAVEMAWSGRTGEIWSTSTNPGETQLTGTTPEGRSRLVASLPGDFILYDVAPDGRVLLGRLVRASEILGSFPDERRERNLSYFDQSSAVGLSASGEALFFVDASTGGGGDLYLRRTDGSPPKRLGGDMGLALSPDGKLILAVQFGTEWQCCLVVPAGPGQTKQLESGGIEWVWSEERGSGFFPDGKSIYYVGHEKGHRRRVWTQSIEGGRPRAVTPEGVGRPVLLGDGRFFCALSPEAEWYLYPAAGNGESHKAAGILPGEQPIQSTPDGLLYVRGAEELKPGETLMTNRIYRLDPWTGTRVLWKEIPPASPHTGGAISTIFFSADGKSCVYTHRRYSVELVLAEGLK